MEEGHPEYEAILAEKERLERTNPAFFDNPEYPFYLASIVAARRGFSAPPASPEKPAVTPRRPARDAAPVVGATATTSNPMDRQDLLRRIEEITSLEEIERLANAVGTKPGAKRY